jgi:hypothetical protein
MMVEAQDAPKIQIKKKKFMVGKFNVTDSWPLSGLTATLGSDYRRKEGYNITYTYDNNGIVLFESTNSNKQPSGSVSEVQVYFVVKSENEVMPRSSYPKLVKIDKLLVDENLTPSMMLAKLSGWKKTDSYIEHSFRMSNGPLYIYFQFTDDEQKLQKISIGRAK